MCISLKTKRIIIYNYVWFADFSVKISTEWGKQERGKDILNLCEDTIVSSVYYETINLSDNT